MLMIEHSNAYDLAEHIFATVQLENDLLTPSDIPVGAGEIRAGIGHMTKARQVISFGDRNDSEQPAWEVLTKGKNDRYYLQATEPYGYTGDLARLKRVVITPGSPESHTIRLLDSFLMRDLSRIAVRSVFPEKF